MKKSVLSVLFVSLTLFAMSQTGVKPKTPVAQAAFALKSANDSVSYAIGVSIASFYKEQGITNINTTAVSAAIKDVLANKKLRMDEATCNTTMNQAVARIQEGKSKGNIDEGAAFLANNKAKPGVKTTASGLQYEVITEGTGAKPAAADSVTCHYKGTLLNGSEFDNSYARGAPITFALNRVIAGWTEGLQLMSVGSKYKLYIPHTLGYGTYDNGPIPGGSTLVFEVELLDVKKAQ
jgi:FKBP-type peptidyl-prolyl cis-trans isomerase